MAGFFCVDSVKCVYVTEFRVRLGTARGPCRWGESEETLPKFPSAGNQTGIGIDGSTDLALEKTLTQSEFRLLIFPNPCYS